MTNREKLGNMSLCDLLVMINNGMIGCIYHALEPSRAYKCGKHDYYDGHGRDCRSCISEYLNEGKKGKPIVIKKEVDK